MAALTTAPSIHSEPGSAHRPRRVGARRLMLPRGYEAIRAVRPGRLRLSGGAATGQRCSGRTVAAGEVLGFVERAGSVEPIVAPGRGIVITSLRSGSLVHGNEIVVRIAPI